MNVSRSKEPFQQLKAYRQRDDGMYHTDDPDSVNNEFALQPEQFEHHPKILIWRPNMGII